MPDVTQKRVALNSLGTLLEGGYALWSSCQDCAEAYRKDLPPELRRRAEFKLDLRALIAGRGPDSPFVGMAPVPCPGCGGRRTSTFMIPPSK